jgi:ABC-type phosphate/phosphonate transport system ATPase subunit
MNKSFAFFGRNKEIQQLRSWHALRKHVLVVGPAGIGKTALLRQIRQQSSLLSCEDTSSLRRICDSIERQLGWTHHKLNIIERKNRLLAHLVRRDEPVAFDHVAHTAPRVARFIALLAEKHRSGSHAVQIVRMKSDIFGSTCINSHAWSSRRLRLRIQANSSWKQLPREIFSRMRGNISTNCIG